MDAQPQRSGRRRRRKNPNSAAKKDAAAEPIFIAARRPGSPRLEKPTRRMKAASARPRSRDESAEKAREEARLDAPAEPAKKREVRIVQRKTDEIDDAEKSRRKLFGAFMLAEGRAAISRTANEYLTAGFTFPREQEAQLKLLEHFDEERARGALAVLAELLAEEDPRQLPVIRQRLRRLEEFADDATIRSAAAELRKTLPGG